MGRHSKPARFSLSDFFKVVIDDSMGPDEIMFTQDLSGVTVVRHGLVPTQQLWGTDSFPVRAPEHVERQAAQLAEDAVTGRGSEEWFRIGLFASFLAKGRQVDPDWLGRFLRSR